jgi:holo-[acyl-carrier protein] synthase
MPLRIGLDLISVDDVRTAVREHGERYLKRVYTDRELRECGADAGRLASRFAAKEATVKALGVVGEPAMWRSIAVHETGGQVSLVLTGAAAEFADRGRVDQLALSLKRETSLATALVIAQLRE